MADFLRIDNLLGKVKNRVYRVGIELEGGWDKLPQGTDQLIHDGSVRGITGAIDPGPQLIPVQARDPNGVPMVTRAGNPLYLAQPQRVRTNNIHTGEIASKILELNQYPAWMKQHYPQHVNETCGLHVHMSFRRALHYSRLMIPEYQQTIFTYLTKWALSEGLPKDHPIWNRLTGKNEFCKAEFFADAQVKRTSKVYDHHGNGNRYTAINYCYGQHQTIECRVLPMLADVDQGIRAVKQVIDVTNACLRFVGKREEKLAATVKDQSVVKYPSIEYV